MAGRETQDLEQIRRLSEERARLIPIIQGIRSRVQHAAANVDFRNVSHDEAEYSQLRQAEERLRVIDQTLSSLGALLQQDAGAAAKHRPGSSGWDQDQYDELSGWK